MTSETHSAAVMLQASIEALSRGDLASWVPLDPQVSLSDLADVLHPLPPLDDGLLFQQPARYVVIPFGGPLPHGITVWVQGTIVTLIEVADMRPYEPVLDALGAPAEKLPSGIGASLEQWPYPEKGLVLHLNPTGETVRRLYGFETLTLEDFKRSPLRFAYVDRSVRRA